MSNATPRRRVALLALVVLVVLQPAPAGVRADAGTGVDGDVGANAGTAVERHPSSAGATADALRRVRADAVHARGLRGSGVDVGVIGRGFDAGDDVVAPHVVDRRQVGDPSRAAGHDTAVAAVVSETAPAADLYLAGVGSTPTPEEYATAIDWLTDRGVDVIVDSGSYFPSVAADERRITAAAERATDRGVVFVTSAGNYADRHWAGTGTDTDGGWVSFADDDAANALADGERLDGAVTVRLRWRSAADYDLYLYRRLPDAPDRVVAKSTGEATGPGLTVEGVDVAVPRGRYYVAVYADDPVATPGRVQVFAARHRLEHATAHGSMVAPATGENVVAVGAARDGERRSYSSLSADGSVDLTAPADGHDRVAPDLVGTSAAAPYVAGTAALVVSAEGDPSPARVESILERTAHGDGDALDALAAVEAATGASAGAATGPSAAGWRGDVPRAVDTSADPASTVDESTDRFVTARNDTDADADGERSPPDGSTSDEGADEEGRESAGDDRSSDEGAGEEGRESAGDDRSSDEGAGEEGRESAGDDRRGTDGSTDRNDRPSRDEG
jgi:hypothetical protein